MDRQDEQENQEQQVLIPSVQDTISFHEKPLIAVCLPDGDYGVVLRWMCENLHLDVKGQVQRIKRSEAISDGLIYVRIQTDGGPQVMPTLILRTVPYWLATIDTRHMDKNDERRIENLEYQRHAVNALYEWAKSVKEIKEPAGLVPAEQMVRPKVPSDGASLEDWEDYHLGMVK